jgi:hypothetical protein
MVKRVLLIAAMVAGCAFGQLNFAGDGYTLAVRLYPSVPEWKGAPFAPGTFVEAQILSNENIDSYTITVIYREPGGALAAKSATACDPHTVVFFQTWKAETIWVNGQVETVSVRKNMPAATFRLPQGDLED